MAKGMRYQVKFPLTDGSPVTFEESTLEDAVKMARRFSNHSTADGPNWWRVVDSRTGRTVADSDNSL